MPESLAPTSALRLARFSQHFASRRLNAAQRLQVGRALIDTVGVALAGRGEPASRAFWQYVAGRAHHGAGMGASAWGCNATLPAEEAALYNGVTGHVLDFDDVNSPLRGHPSIALLPPLVALAQLRDLDGGQLASAYAVGFETMVRLARAMVHEHYARGWHATTTLGTVGAALACSHLLGLSEQQSTNAIGLAVAQAAGTRGNFGFMAKSFQAGHCAASGARAALLAELGVDAAPDALDGAQGFTRLYGNGENLAEALDGLEAAGQADGELELDASGIEIKKYPMCYAAHRAIDGMLDLRGEHGLSPRDVVAIHVRANRRALVPLIHAYPQTGLEAKFSMQYAMAAALVDGHVRLSSFTDEAVRRTSVQDLMRLVGCAQDDGPQTPRWNVLAITLKSGDVLRKEIRQLRGSAECPLNEDELREKWQDCLDYAGAQTGSGKAFFESALALDRTTVRDLFRKLPVLG